MRERQRSLLAGEAEGRVALPGWEEGLGAGGGLADAGVIRLGCVGFVTGLPAAASQGRCDQGAARGAGKVSTRGGREAGRGVMGEDACCAPPEHTFHNTRRHKTRVGSGARLSHPAALVIQPILAGGLCGLDQRAQAHERLGVRQRSAALGPAELRRILQRSSSPGPLLAERMVERWGTEGRGAGRAEELAEAGAAGRHPSLLPLTCCAHA